MTGQTLSHYEVLEKVGAGGMGVVYKARDLTLDRFVALKFLAAHLTESETAHARFLREARSISALNHPNIATIYEVGESGGDSFLAFEYIAGGTLRARLAALKASGLKMPLPDVLTVATELAEGLAHAHRNGILHRDIKPGNLMFSAEGKLKIMDFGLSKLLSGPEITKGSTRLGTVLYMSPEQAAGQAADQRSDIFSFGVVLYEMLAGERPFRGEDEAQALDQVLHSQPIPIEQLHPDTPSTVSRVVDRALEKDPAKRYQRMEQVLADLRAVTGEFEGPTATAAEPGRLRPARGIRLTRNTWVLIASAVLLIAALLVSRALLRGRLPEHKEIAVLPFTNIGTASNQPFCDGLVETLTSVLTQMQGFQQQLLVVPSSEVRRQGVTSPSDARRVFKANLAITGSVQRTGDRVRVIANLVDTQSPPHNLNSRLITRSVKDLAKLQDELVDSMAGLLELELQSRARTVLAAGKTSVGSAYDMYLQGRGYLDRWDKPGNLDLGLALMQKAISLDSHFGLAYAGLGWAKWRKFTSTKDPKLLEQAQELALQAISIDNRVALAHITLGLVYKDTGRYQDAERSYQAALDFDPISVEACRGLAQAYEAEGKLESAEKAYARAIQLRPGDWQSQTLLGTFYSSHGRYVEAEAAFRKVVELTPDNFVAYRNMGSIHYLMGRYEEAAKEYRTSIQLKPTPNAYLGLAAIYYTQGQYREAAATNEKALKMDSGNSYSLLGNLADCYRFVPELAARATETYRRAIAVADKYLATNPTDGHALGSRAEFYAKLGDVPHALQDAERALAADPKNVRTIYDWSLVQEFAHHRARALAGLSNALKGGYSVEDLRRDPDFANLRRDARFAELIAPFISIHPKQ